MQVSSPDKEGKKEAVNEVIKGQIRSLSSVAHYSGYDSGSVISRRGELYSIAE